MENALWKVCCIKIFDTSQAKGEGGHFVTIGTLRERAIARSCRTKFVKAVCITSENDHIVCYTYAMSGG